MTLQRVLGLVILLVAGVLSLPLAAAPFDGQGSENWIVPVQLAGMAVLGAVVGLALPGFVVGPLSRRTIVGGATGLGMALVGLVVFFLLLNGFSGA